MPCLANAVPGPQVPSAPVARRGHPSGATYL